MRPFWYLGTPYSKFPAGIHAAFQIACQARGMFVREGLRVFSPIVHSHPVAIESGIDPLDHQIWMDDELPFMAAAFGLIVYMAATWETSLGVLKEIEHFKGRGRPILYALPFQISETVMRARSHEAQAGL